MGQKIKKSSINHCEAKTLNFKLREKICQYTKKSLIVHNHIDSLSIPSAWRKKTLKIYDPLQLMSIKNIRSPHPEIKNKIALLKRATVFIHIPKLTNLEKTIYNMTTFAKYYKICLIIEFMGGIDAALTIAKYSDSYMWVENCKLKIIKKSLIYQL